MAVFDHSTLASALPGLFHHGEGGATLLHHFPRDFEFFQLLLAGQIEHEIEHEFFQNHAQSARTHLARHGLACDGSQRLVAELQAHIFELKQPLVLLDDRVFRAGQNFDQGRLVQIFQHAYDRQPSHEFGNQPEFDQVFRLDFAQQFVIPLARDYVFLFRIFAAAKAERLFAHAPPNDLFQAYEGSTADEKNVRGVDGGKLLVRMLSSALRGNVGNRSFQNFQKGLLDALTRNVASDRRILILPSDLVNFINVNNSGLGSAYVPVGGLQQLEDDVLHILADVSGFGQGGGIDDGEGHVQHAGQSLRQQRLSRAGWTDQHDVRLGQFDAVAGLLAIHEDALVVVVNRYRQLFLGLFLPDDELVEEGFHFLRLG